MACKSSRYDWTKENSLFENWIQPFLWPHNKPSQEQMEEFMSQLQGPNFPTIGQLQNKVKNHRQSSRTKVLIAAPTHYSQPNDLYLEPSNLLLPPYDAPLPPCDLSLLPGDLPQQAYELSFQACSYDFTAVLESFVASESSISAEGLPTELIPNTPSDFIISELSSTAASEIQPLNSLTATYIKQEQDQSHTDKDTFVHSIPRPPKRRRGSDVLLVSAQLECITLHGGQSSLEHPARLYGQTNGNLPLSMITVSSDGDGPTYVAGAATTGLASAPKKPPHCDARKWAQFHAVPKVIQDRIVRAAELQTILNNISIYEDLPLDFAEVLFREFLFAENKELKQLSFDDFAAMLEYLEMWKVHFARYGGGLDGRGYITSDKLRTALIDYGLIRVLEDEDVEYVTRQSVPELSNLLRLCNVAFYEFIMCCVAVKHHSHISTRI